MQVATSLQSDTSELNSQAALTEVFSCAGSPVCKAGQSPLSSLALLPKPWFPLFPGESVKCFPFRVAFISDIFPMKTPSPWCMAEMFYGNAIEREPGKIFRRSRLKTRSVAQGLEHLADDEASFASEFGQVLPSAGELELAQQSLFCPF